ncbi:ATP-dependent DNA helicase PIF1-like [Planococcus citri]|uniref:ATP-dependent DNA helicase PIF1-like n=1 Tax=Planococcus citri TaxID=170843 RepID=UPI0031F8668C
MAPAYALDAVDRLLQDLMNSKEPFGNKLILCGGDFRQILPIVVRGSRVDIVLRCVKNSKVWKYCQTRKLSQNMRTGTDEIEFANWLKKLGDGELEINSDISQYAVQIPSECVLGENDDIVSFVYGNEALSTDNIKKFINSVILCPKNDSCAVINGKVLDKLAGQLKSYCSADSIILEGDEKIEEYSLEFINSLTPSGLPPHNLLLKEGTIVMLIRNLNASRGLVNGTRLMIKRMHNNSLYCEVLTGQLRGETLLIPRMDLTSSDSSLPFIIKRRQFPVKVAFAITINKCQGQTFDKVGLYLPDVVFSHGQLYVAFSRVRRKCDIKVKICKTRVQGIFSVDDQPKIYTSNVVFKEVLN